jgi:hypothetical protein
LKVSIDCNKLQQKVKYSESVNYSNEIANKYQRQVK